MTAINIHAPVNFTDEHGTSFEAVYDWDSGAVGFRCQRAGMEPEYVMLNPSSDSDDGVSTVFVYHGPTGDPGQDPAYVHFDLFEASTHPCYMGGK